MFPPSKSHHHLHTLTEVFTLAEVFLNLTEVFLTLTEDFPCFFLSCKANVRVKIAKTGHGPHSSTLVVICVVRLLFVLFYVLLCVNVYCHRVTTQLQLTNISYIISIQKTRLLTKNSACTRWVVLQGKRFSILRFELIWPWLYQMVSLINDGGLS